MSNGSTTPPNLPPQPYRPPEAATSRPRESQIAPQTAFKANIIQNVFTPAGPGHYVVTFDPIEGQSGQYTITVSSFDREFTDAERATLTAGVQRQFARFTPAEQAAIAAQPSYDFTIAPPPQQGPGVVR